LKINKFEKLLGSGFYTGYIPYASGTFGSMVALIIYFIPGFEKPEILIPMILLFLVLGIKIGGKFEEFYGKDPTECTIDEIVGMWISLLFIPKHTVYIIIAFVIWRFFDIIKPYPANKVEEIKGGLGIMLDDVIAGIYALIVVNVIVLFIENFPI